jgi:NADPH:quinone reductase-like Zn-dependent oxidoreductase
MKLRNKVLGGSLALVLVAIAVMAAFISHNSPCAEAPPLPAGERMKAIVYRCYGPPTVLKYEDVPKPRPADNEVLVRVYAAAVNPLDWHYMRGEPYLVRTEAGFGAPRDVRMGVDFSGTVEAVGKSVKRFNPGDAVFGGKNGAFAEYVSVREDRSIVRKPANVTFEQAAAAPIAGITALQALRDKGAIEVGHKVLINGASGGVGTFAVQIAKSFGAEVTAVCSARNVSMARSIGADHVIDYDREDYTKGDRRYDLIIDMVGNHSLLENRHALTPTGTFVIVGGPNDGRWLGPMTVPIKAVMLSPFVEQKFLPFLAQLNHKDLSTLADLMREGKVTPVIDRQYPLSKAQEAIAFLEDGHARGKVILNVAKEG